MLEFIAKLLEALRQLPALVVLITEFLNWLRSVLGENGPIAVNEIKQAVREARKTGNTTRLEKAIKSVSK